MSINPYQVPAARLETIPESVTIELASRGERFVAALIDTAIQLIIVLPMFYLMGVFDNRSISNNPWLDEFIFIVFGFAVFVVVHGYFLHAYGQTIGKRAMKIAIVDMNNQLPPLLRLLFLRHAPVHLISLFGNLLPLLDVLFIFRQSRRCLHDLIAGTKVVQVSQ